MLYVDQENAGGSRTHLNRVAAGRLAIWLQRFVVGLDSRRSPWFAVIWIPDASTRDFPSWISAKNH